MSIRHRIGKALRSLRMERGLSLSEVAEISGLNRPNLSALETEGVGATIEKLEKLCAVYDISLHDLFRKACNCPDCKDK